MKDDMKATIEAGLEMQRYMMDGPHETHMSHAVRIEPDGKKTVFAFDPSFMGDWRDKDKLSLHLLKELYDHPESALAFCSDAWMGTPPEGLDISTLPQSLNKWPREYVQEFLMCTCNKVGEKGIFASQMYKRKGKQIEWGEIDWDVAAHLAASPEQAKTESRFVFDLRTADLKTAIEKALGYGTGRFKTRNGRVPPNDTISTTEN